MSTLILYTTLGCHLCEQAKALIEPLLLQHGALLHQVDIADSSELMAKYAIRIPVLAAVAAGDATGGELYWPFTAAEVMRYLRDNP